MNPSSPVHAAQFGWHEEAQALVFNLQPPGRQGITVMIAVDDLKRQGWTVTADGLRQSLPRVDDAKVVGHADPLTLHALDQRGGVPAAIRTGGYGRAFGGSGRRR